MNDKDEQGKEKEGAWFIGSNEGMQQAHEELIKILKGEAEKHKINIDDVIEKLNKVNDLGEAYIILAEFIPTIPSRIAATEIKNK